MIEQLAHEETGRSPARSAALASRSLLEHLLDSLPQGFLDYRLMLTRMAKAFVTDLTYVNWVREHLIKRTSTEPSSNAGGRSTGACGACREPHRSFSQQRKTWRPHLSI
jgi:hypothetical protein